MNNFFNLFISAVLSIMVLYDLTALFRKVKGKGQVNYTVSSTGRAVYYASIVLLILVLLFTAYVYKLTKDAVMLLIGYWMLLLLIKVISELGKSGGIYDTGVGFAGRFYAWGDINAYYCNISMGMVILSVNKKLFNYKYKSKLRLQVVKAQAFAIDGILAVNIKKA